MLISYIYTILMILYGKWWTVVGAVYGRGVYLTFKMVDQERGIDKDLCACLKFRCVDNEALGFFTAFFNVIMDLFILLFRQPLYPLGDRKYTYLLTILNLIITVNVRRSRNNAMASPRL